MGQDSGSLGAGAAGSSWTRHWRDGARHSCSGFAGADGSAILEHVWRDFAAGLPMGAVLADLACGPGQAGRWASAQRPDLRVIGVDLADIADGEPGDGFQILGGVPLEALVFADEELDAVISQFGFEYGALEPAAAEVARVLKPGGRGLFVMHHQASAIGREYAMRGEAFRSAIIGEDLVAGARELFALQQSGAEWRAAQSALVSRMGAVRKRMADTPAWTEAWAHLRYLGDLAVRPRRFEPASAIERLDVIAVEAEAWMFRYAAQKAASLDEAGVARLLLALAANGLQVDAPVELAGDDGEVLAWRLGFRRPA